MAEKRKTIKQLEAELFTAVESKKVNYQNYCDARERAMNLEKSLEESRSHFGDLKKRLLEAETELARLRGYLDRVHEDDIVRDGMVEITDGDGTRQVPKRPPPMRVMNGRGYSDGGISADQFGRPKKSTHWTSY